MLMPTPAELKHHNGSLNPPDLDDEDVDDEPTCNNPTMIKSIDCVTATLGMVGVVVIIVGGGLKLFGPAGVSENKDPETGTDTATAIMIIGAAFVVPAVGWGLYRTIPGCVRSCYSKLSNLTSLWRSEASSQPSSSQTTSLIHSGTTPPKSYGFNISSGAV